MNVECGQFHTMDGLDAGGKSSIIKGLHEQYNAVVLRCPPDWMKAYRSRVEHAPVNMRFLFYAFGNVWVDRFFLQPEIQKNPDQLFLQDRSWLTTLAAHEDRGTSPVWLRIGERLAQSCTKPNSAVIVHVDRQIREQRMIERGEMTESDRRNLKYDAEYDQKYLGWAQRLDWSPYLFDNTHLTLDQAIETMAQHFNVKK